MRLLIAVSILVAIAGCRSPDVAYRAQVSAANTYDSISPVIATPTVDSSAAQSIEELVQVGLLNNPGIKEARHRIRSLQFRIPQELSLPDPMATTTTHLAPVETAAGRQAFALGVSQKFVNVDRRATKAAIAHDAVRAAEAGLIKIEQELAEQIRIACYQLLLIRETIRVTQEDFESLAQIEEVILRQYEVKKSVSQQDVLNVQVEQSKVENQLTVLRQRERSHQARLARLLHNGPASRFTLVDSLSGNESNFDADQLIASALETRPELESQMARIRSDRRKICLANLQNKPDFTVGLNWIGTSSDGISPVANGDDALLLGIGFNLPVYKDRIRAAACEAKEARLASTAKLEVIQDAIAEEVFDSVAKLESTGTTMMLLQDDIIPKSERTLELAIEEYSTGKTDYTPLIENWRSVLRYRVALANLQSQQLQFLASLARQVGQLEPINTSNSVQPPQAYFEEEGEEVDMGENVDERDSEESGSDSAESSRKSSEN